MTPEQATDVLDGAYEQGFDKSYISLEDGVSVRIRCSQCDALVIQGVPCHETGCPNERKARQAAQLAERTAEAEDECDS